MRDDVERLASIIRGDANALHDVDLALVTEAQAHGVHGFIRQTLVAANAWSSIDADARGVLESDVHRSALTDRYFRRQTMRAVTALSKAGVAALTFKGEAVACTHYPSPHLRPRCDTDLLVEKRDASAAEKVLESLGYTRGNAVARALLQTQRVFRESQGALRHVIDLHWDISYRPFFGGCFSFDELMRDAVEIGDAAPGLRAPNPAYALMLACLHRVMHHENSRQLIWLYDIALLAERLSEDEWAQVHRLAVDKSLCEVCAIGIEMAAECFGCTPGTSAQLTALRALGRHREEPSRVYLGSRRGSLGRVLLDARHAGNPLRTVRLLASHVFPDTEYMRRKYGARDPVSLAGSYVYRAASGFRKLVS